MARRRINPELPFDPAATRVAANFIMRPVELPGVELVTLRAPRPTKKSMPKVKGRFVRIHPREGATDSQVEELVRWCQANGALGIKRLPIPKSDVISAKQRQEVIETIEELAGESNHNTMKSVVVELVEQSSIDASLKAELLEYCQTTLEDCHVSDED